MLEQTSVTNGKTEFAPALKGGLMRRARKAPKSGTEAAVIDLTPKLAKELLLCNFDNRPISIKRVESFAADIRDGRWEFNGETIIVADTGEMNDGQHRCHAVIMADKSIPTLLVKGVSRASRFTRVRSIKSSVSFMPRTCLGSVKMLTRSAPRASGT